MTIPNASDPSVSPALLAAVEAGNRSLGRSGRAYPLFATAPTGHEVVAATEMLAGDRLRRFFERSILEWTDHPEEEDVRAAASRFARRYCGSIVAAALGPLAHGLALDVSLPRVSLVVRTEMPMGVVLDVPRAVLATTDARPSTWPVSGLEVVRSAAKLREIALRTLFERNLVPAFRTILDHAHLSPRLLWATAAEQIDLLYESALTQPGQSHAAEMTHDREAILFGGVLAGVPGPNPMLGLLEWEPSGDAGHPRPLQVRTICCACYVIPGRNAYCRTCGLLTREQRLEMWRRWWSTMDS